MENETKTETETEIETETETETETDLGQYAQRITKAWMKTRDGILEVARLCAEASEKLSAKDKNTLLAQLPFKAATFSKLVKVGNDERLRDPNVRQHLPPNYSTLYAVTKLDEGQLKGAIDSGALHPEARRIDIEALSSPDLGQASQLVLGYVRLTAKFAEARLNELETRLNAVAAEFEVDFVKRRTPEERIQLACAKAVSVCTNQRNKYLGVFARKKIKDLKAEKLRGSEKLAPKQRALKWGFSERETYIGPDYTPDQVREVLERVGLGEEFEPLRKKADLVVDMPAP